MSNWKNAVATATQLINRRMTWSNAAKQSKGDQFVLLPMTAYDATWRRSSAVKYSSTTNVQLNSTTGIRGSDREFGQALMHSSTRHQYNMNMWQCWWTILKIRSKMAGQGLIHSLVTTITINDLFKKAACKSRTCSRIGLLNPLEPSQGPDQNPPKTLLRRTVAASRFLLVTACPPRRNAAMRHSVTHTTTTHACSYTVSPSTV